jgi:hypothetical protein
MSNGGNFLTLSVKNYSDGRHKISCDKCETRQELSIVPFTDNEVFVRIGNGNVELVGCEEHVRMLLEKLRETKR